MVSKSSAFGIKVDLGSNPDPPLAIGRATYEFTLTIRLNFLLFIGS